MSTAATMQEDNRLFVQRAARQVRRAFESAGGDRGRRRMRWPDVGDQQDRLAAA